MRIMTVLFLLSLVLVLPADTAVPGNTFEAPNPVTGKAPVQHRPPVDFSFHTLPTELLTTFYDYMPGSYAGNPLAVLESYNGVNGAVYGVFHARETSSSARRVFNFYVDENGNVSTPTYVADNTLWEGYPNLAIDPETYDPFFVYHVNFGQPDTHIQLVFDVWHLLGNAGLLSLSYNVIDNQNIAGVHTPYADDQFVWPYVFISKAPSYETDGKRRIYVQANNNTTHMVDPSENVLITYADFTTLDIENSTIQDLDWSYLTLPLLDDYNADNGVWGRYNKSFCVTPDGKIAAIGYLVADDIDHAGSNHVVFYNDNFAEGAWEVYQIDATSPVDNPLNQDGTPYFDTEFQLFFDWVNSSHPIALFDDNGDLHFIGNQVLGYEDDLGDHYLYGYFSYVKELMFRPADQSFQRRDLYPTGLYQNDDQIYLPWDEDADGEIDDYWDEEEGVMPGDEGYGTVNPVNGWPIWWHGWDEAFHENTYKLAMNQNHGWMAAVWHDGLKNRYYNDMGDEDYIEWDGVPEIMISIASFDSDPGPDETGIPWQEPIRLNANETPELAGMTPCYVYVADHITDLGDGHGLLHMMFLDDASFGSFIQGQGSNSGGTITYCSLDIDFNPVDATDTPAPPETLSLQAAPNPFNPQTTITFELPGSSHATLDIYNIRGQHVKRICDRHLSAGKHSFVWDASASRPASSGVYLARLTAGGKAVTSKLILMK